MEKFEDRYEEIEVELEKRRYKWTLKAVNSLDYDDIKQIISLHIYIQWEKWDQDKPFLPWVNTVISNQTINLLRNLYFNVSRPCVRCPANEGDNHCRLYGTQCNSCPIYARWEKTKKNAYNVKLPVSIENHLQETDSIGSTFMDLEKMAANLHPLMKKCLSPIQYKVYKALYIDNKSDEEVAELMKYKSNEKNRSEGYKQINNTKKIIIEKARKIIRKEDLN